ncbi:MAG: hypothetical protein FK730_08400 [Asgard group archaeon]|nr:hypothetical protein [Asgard group archaeon]
MDLEKFIGKSAADKNSKKLGKIVKIEKIQDTKTKIWKPYILIHVKNFLRKDVIILVEASKIIKSDDFHVWFDINKNDFDQEVLETRALMHLYKE